MYTIFYLLIVALFLIYILSLAKKYYSYETFYVTNCNNSRVNDAILAISKDICEMENKLSNKRADNFRYTKMYKWFLTKTKTPDITKLSNSDLQEHKNMAANYLEKDSRPQKLNKSNSREEATIKNLVSKNINSQTNQLSDEELRQRFIKLKTEEELEEEYDNTDIKHVNTREHVAKTSMFLSRKQMEVIIENIQKRSFTKGVNDIKTGKFKDNDNISKIPKKGQNAIS